MKVDLIVVDFMKSWYCKSWLRGSWSPKSWSRVCKPHAHVNWYIDSHTDYAMIHKWTQHFFVMSITSHGVPSNISWYTHLHKWSHKWSGLRRVRVRVTHVYQCIIGASLSEPHTIVVYGSTCIDRPTGRSTDRPTDRPCPSHSREGSHKFTPFETVTS